jgi:hypothetical protein
MENGNGGWNARPQDGESLANLVKWLVLTICTKRGGLEVRKWK